MLSVYDSQTWYGGGDADPGLEHTADVLPLLTPLFMPPLPIDVDGIIPKPPLPHIDARVVFDT